MQKENFRKNRLEKPKLRKKQLNSASLTSLEPDTTIRILPEHTRSYRGSANSGGGGSGSERNPNIAPSEVYASHLVVLANSSTITKQTGVQQNMDDATLLGLPDVDVDADKNNEGKWL